MVYGKFMVDSPLDIIPYRIPHDTLPFGKKNHGQEPLPPPTAPEPGDCDGKKAAELEGFRHDL